ncbi:ethanolamine ammonia-lyase subunit EutC [Neoroseomonas oryzicola]|uniref:Ethanolamine ammonia-lyase small subunit n=1 Tax=Neoroseomonas oryzicola TaxID=535904 RepID=A0A9X9WI51_9PROT|nr:ethanolamine ammonia-lyase subunit EutC [Neoroseomonas oryzicola]MBR0660011.1 ethanolamine ammonia-lyase subunit EutC [Neoroseomonas oryzicola]NKE19436.1 ethanolamine ammonia-lyase subunit EutC [Neoroseomonas oryzicola]
MSTPSLWRDLRRFTDARVGLGRAGTAQPTLAHLDFQESHARARDAVWSSLDVAATEAAVAPLGLPVVRVRSAVPDRRAYLLRPDLGRRLAEGTVLPRAPGSVVFVVADGLCAIGVQRHAPAVLERLVPALDLPTGPIVIAEQARVALGDEIGEATGAAAVVMLIGERPGLSATDSLGVYITWAPRRGRTDAERNCISNVRPGGLSYDEAAAKTAWLLRAAQGLGATGVALKDEMPAGALPAP